MQEIKARYGERLNEILGRLHRYPEIAFREQETTRLIREVLCSIGFEIVELDIKTGVAARLRTGKPGPVIGLRADIDGIEQQEAAERPDKSVNEGVMHACGHDTHAAGLLGAAMALADIKETLSGDVVVIFQPAEETIAGAKYLISHGLLELAPMDAIFAFHNAPDMPVGQIGLKQGTLMSGKDDFRITVRGKGGHGAFPHKCTDPMIAACATVGALQSIVSRNISPQATAVVSVCTIQGGHANNLIPDEVVMTCGARTFDVEVQEQVKKRIAEIAQNTTAAYGCTAEIEYYATVPPLINSEELYEAAKIATEMTAAPEKILEPSVNFASEDFAIYCASVPGFYYFLGSGTPGSENAAWHSAHFRADPDTVFWGAELLKNSVLAAQNYLGKG